MKLGDLKRVLELDAERSRIVEQLRGIESDSVVVIIGDALAEPDLAECTKAPLRHVLAMRLSCNALALRQLGVTID